MGEDRGIRGGNNKMESRFPICPWCKKRYMRDALRMIKRELLCPNDYVLRRYNKED